MRAHLIKSFLFVFFAYPFAAAPTAVAAPSDGGADEVLQTLVGTWYANDTFFETVTFTSEIDRSQPCSTNPQFLFHGRLSERFCQNAAAPCPQNREVKGGYMVDGQFDNENPEAARLWIQSDAMIFDDQQGVGYLFHPRMIYGRTAQLELIPSFDFHDMIKPNQVIMRKNLR